MRERNRRWVHTFAAGLLLAVGVLLPAAPASAAPDCEVSGTIPAPTEAPWELTRLEPSRVWPLTRGAGVTVAVIDSGVAGQHIALKDNLVPGRDFGLPDEQGQCDNVGHGTLVAGIIAGRQDSQIQFSGVAPAARILPIRVLDNDEQNNDPALPGRIAQAIRWAADQPNVKVINLSLKTIPSTELASAVRYAITTKDIVVVAAAGNLNAEGRTLAAFPAAYDGVIAVAGIKPDGSHVETSISDKYVDLAAPGLENTGPAPSRNRYQYKADGGTSFAAPYVSGVAALVRSYRPELTVAEVTDRLEKTADHPAGGRDIQVGYGVVNPYEAVTTLLGTRPDTRAKVMPMPVAPVDPLATVKKAAAWSAAGGVLLVVLLFMMKPVLRRGREHGWRPRRAAHQDN